MTLYRMVAPYFVAGVVIDKGVVTRAAPIIGWAVGKHPNKLWGWVGGRGYEIEKVE